MDTDPTETLLRLVCQSSVRVIHYSRTVRAASVQYGVDDEYTQGLIQLEQAERDRFDHFSRTALAAGIAQRQIDIAEAQARVIFNSASQGDGE
jgi:hypothetical protein